MDVCTPPKNIARSLLERLELEAEKKIMQASLLPIPDPVSLGFLQSADLDHIVDRGPFLATFANVVLGRAIEGVDDPAKRGSCSKWNNPLMGTFSPPGTGKTYSIGLLMELTRRLFAGGSEALIAREYLQNELGTKWGDQLADYLQDYVVIPITFNDQQPTDELGKESDALVLSRILHCLVNSLPGKKLSVSQCESIVAKIRHDCYIGWGITLSILDLIFQGKAKFIFAIDDIMSIEDTERRLSIISATMSLMDFCNSSLIYMTSSSAQVYSDWRTETRREIYILPMTRCPSLILRNENLMELIKGNRAFMPVLFDLCAVPKLLGSRECIEDLTRQKCWSLGEMLKSRVDKVDISLVSAMTEETVKNFIKNLFDKRHFGHEYCENVGYLHLADGNVRRICFNDLIERGMLVSLGVMAFISPCRSMDSDFDPEALVPVLIRALLEVESGRAVAKPCAAFWALALCLVNPCTDFGCKLFFAVNELLRRTKAFHGKDYFSTPNEPKNEQDTGSRVYWWYLKSHKDEIPLAVHSRHYLAFTDASMDVDCLIRDLDTILSSDSNVNSSFKHQFIRFKSGKPEADGTESQSDAMPTSAAVENKGVLSELSDEDFKTFSYGGILLINTPNRSGYDFLIGDGPSITFYKVDCSFTRSDVCNQDVEELYGQCKLEFETALKREENAFTDWRLVFFTFRNPPSVTLHHNLFFIGHKKIAKMFPQTFLKRLEFSKYDSEQAMFEHLKMEMKEVVQKQLHYLEFLEEDLKGEEQSPDVENQN